MKNTKKTGLLGLIEEIETMWATHYASEDYLRQDNYPPSPAYRWIESKKLAARLKRIYTTEVEPLKQARLQDLDMSTSVGCGGSTASTARIANGKDVFTRIALFCIREDEDGNPCAGRLLKRRYLTQTSADNESVRRWRKGWTRVVCLNADNALHLQFAHWASSLLGINPRYVLDPLSLVGYVSGPNWDAPGVEYAHYEERIKGYGDALWREFSAYRSIPTGDAVKRMEHLLVLTGLRKR